MDDIEGGRIMERLAEADLTIKVGDVEFSATPMQWHAGEDGQPFPARLVIDHYHLRFSSHVEDLLIDVALAARDAVPVLEADVQMFGRAGISDRALTRLKEALAAVEWKEPPVIARARSDRG